jgi:phosphatidylethanolamine-binding protein (PEBP) family uncharacterized protein
MKFLNVIFNGRQINNEEKVNIQDVLNKPKIKVNLNRNKLYTIMMVDPDAPSCTNPINKYWLHWLIVNTTDIILPFKPPSPPPGSGEHRYYIFLLEQQNQIKIKTIPDRPKFDINKFINEHNLKPDSYAMFRTEIKK